MSNWNQEAPAQPKNDASEGTEKRSDAAPAPTGRLSKNITLNQFTLYAPSTKNPDKMLRLTVGVSGTGFPFMSVDADENIQEKTKENNFGKLTARLGGTVFFTLLNMLKFAKTKESGWKMGLQNFHTYINGKHLDKPQHSNDILVGVDNDSCVWMTIVENGRESVRFFFGPTEWHNWKKADGEMASRKEMNHWSLDGYVSGVSLAMSSIMGHHAVVGTGEEKSNTGGNNNAGGGQGGWQKKPWQNGGGNGGGNWKDRQGGGQWQKKPWQNNGGGGGQGGWQKKPWQNGGGNGGGGNWNKGGNQSGGGWNKDGNNFGGQRAETSDSSELGDFDI